MMRFFKQLFKRNRIELNSLDAYALWAKNYPPTAHNRLMEIEQAALVTLLPDLTNQRVLDAAGGTGRYAHLARQGGAQQVIYFDNSFEMLKAGTSPARVQASLMDFPFATQSFDVAVCALALGHLVDIVPVFCEFARVIKPGGKLLISEFHPFQTLRGAKRTFQTSDGHHYAVRHHAHLYADYHAVAARCGFQMDAVLEPTLSAEERMPVVLVMRLNRV